jgi:starch synthase
MRVLQVSAEIFPLLKTGGLADIAGALPAALKLAGCEMRVLLPGFSAILSDLKDDELVCELTTPWGELVALRRGRLAALHVVAYVIDAPALYARAGGPYEDLHRKPFADNHRRFGLLGFVASRLANGLDADWQPQVVHSHDWHAALAPAYLRFNRDPLIPRVASVYTVHNLAYQGLFDASHWDDLGLPDAAFALDGLEFHGQISFMKAGLFYADGISTVSPTYAREIQTPEQGCGLDGLLRSRANVLTGILNGVDDAVWNPAHDALIPFAFDARKPAGKAQCKAVLQEELGLAIRDDVPLFCVVSRLTEQKGLHLVLGGLEALMAQGGQMVLLGNGEAWLEEALREFATAHPSAVSVRIGYDESYAHRLFAASDVTMVPSRFEPCGLTQMYGLKYGSLPLVHRVGGLADTVVDCSLENLADNTASGFVFGEFHQEDFQRAVRRAFALFDRRAEWNRVRARAMRQALGWESSAAKYVELYQNVLDHG